jgi:hypothetical protein
MDHDDIVEAIRAKRKAAQEPQEPQEPMDLMGLEDMPGEWIDLPEPEETPEEKRKRRLRELLG